MSKIKRIRPTTLLLYFAVFASFANCVFIAVVIFSFRNQNKKFSELLSKVSARPAESVHVAQSVNVAQSNNAFSRFASLPRLERISSSAPSASPYAHIRPPRPGSDMAQVITHDGEMRYVRYSKLPAAWRKANK